MKRLLLIVLCAAACGGTPEPARSTPVVQSPAQIAEAQPAIEALQASKFEDARQIASRIMQQDPASSRAAAVRALVTYQAAGHALITQLGEIADRGDHLRSLDHQAGRDTWLQFLGALESVERDLAIAATDKQFSLELCLACWEHDWNRNGQIDDRDRRLFELEYDGKGGEIPEGDPRRRPTFRFDVGDVAWAQAMVSFQKAAVELVLAYRWSELDKLFAFNIFGNAKLDRITIKLIDPGRVKAARAAILAGLDFSDASREMYQRETDDDREWLPNPRQQSHPIPLPVDAALYATWEHTTADLHRMMTSAEGLSMREVMGLLDPKAADLVPDAYLDLGAMFREPTDIVLDLGDMSEKRENITRVLKGLLGNGYKVEMKASPIVTRLRQMKDDLERGGDTVEHKLRYLLWVN